MTVQAAHILVSGRVQAVGYRFSAIVQANQHGLVGWIRNTPDGHVEIVAEGPAAAMEALIDWCWRGPSAARVEEVRVDWREPTGTFTSFDVRY